MAHKVDLFGPAHGPKEWKTASAWLAVAHKLFNVALAAAILSLAYLVYGLFSGEYSRFPISGDKARTLTGTEQVRLLSNFSTALTVFAWSAWISCLVSLAFAWGGETATLVVAALGLVCYVVLPMGVSAVLERQSIVPNHITDQLVAAFESVGKVALVLAMLRFVGRTLFVLATRPTARKAEVPAADVVETISAKPAKPKERRHLIRRCWEMAYCSERLRFNCPSYVNKQSCWRRHTGCQCDPHFAIRILEPMSKAAAQQMSPDERAAVDRLLAQGILRDKHHAEKETCQRCPIYMEHQIYKYRAVFWLAYPLTVAAMYFGWPVIHEAYQRTEQVLTNIARGMSLLPNTQPELAPFVNGVLSVDVEVLVVAAIGLVLVSWLLRAFEWAIFEAKV